MKRKKIVTVDVEPKALPPCDPATLGTRMVSYWEVNEIKVGDTDLGKDLVVWRNVEKFREQVCPDITLDEAIALEATFGKQDWKPWHKGGEFTCTFTHEGSCRRFIITQDIYDKLGHDEG